MGAFVLARIVNYLLKRYLDKASERLLTDPTQYRFFRNFISVLIISSALVLAMMLIPPLKEIGVTLFAGAGIFAAIVGFASQQAFSNIVSGIFIVLFKPFRVGDIITVGPTGFGTVEDITLRHTVIRNPENRRLVIPNSVMSSETILNSSLEDEKTCAFVEIGISYDSDVDLAMAIMQDEARKHPLFIDARTPEEKADDKPDVPVRVLSLAESSVLIRANVWAAKPGDAFIVRTDMYKSVKQRFDREGIEIPFPHRTLVFKNGKAADLTDQSLT